MHSLGKRLLMFGDSGLSCQALRDVLGGLGAAVIDSALPQAGGCSGQGDASFPSGSVKYSSLSPCKKGLLKLSDCFEIMTGVTQISSLSSLLSKAPEPGLTAQREIPKK